MSFDIGSVGGTPAAVAGSGQFAPGRRALAVRARAPTR